MDPGLLLKLRDCSLLVPQKVQGLLFPHYFAQLSGSSSSVLASAHRLPVSVWEGDEGSQQGVRVIGGE